MAGSLTSQSSCRPVNGVVAQSFLLGLAKWTSIDENVVGADDVANTKTSTDEDMVSADDVATP